jgi:hypothetical protein
MKRPGALALAVLACLIAASLFSASALGLSIPVGNSLPLEVEGMISPSKLSKTIYAPISLTWDGKFSAPPQGTKYGLKSLLSLQFDKNIAIFTKGLSTCTLSAAEETEQSCPKAIVGHGNVEMGLESPERPAFYEKGPVVIYNGAHLGGRPSLIFRFQPNGPLPLTLSATGVFRKATGKFGTQTSIELPDWFYGKLYLTGLQMTIGKSWNYKGKKVGLLSAKCPKGSLLIHSEYEFGETGTKVSREIANHCG